MLTSAFKAGADPGFSNTGGLRVLHVDAFYAIWALFWSTVIKMWLKNMVDQNLEWACA